MIDQPLLTVKRIAQMAEAGTASDYFHAIARTAGSTNILLVGRFGNGRVKLHINAF